MRRVCVITAVLAVDMKICYHVTALAKGKYAVAAELSEKTAGCQLFSPNSFGPATHFFAAFSHWYYVDQAGKTRRLFRQGNGQQIELPEAVHRFGYRVSLGRRRNLLEQMHQAKVRRQFVFMLGLAMFPAASVAASYEVQWEQETYCGFVGQGNHFCFSDSRSLMLAPFVQGDYSCRKADKQPWYWVCPSNDAKSMGMGIEDFSRLAAVCADWFGGMPEMERLTCYTWLEPAASRGLGYSCKGSCVCAFPLRRQGNDRYWLVLHELIHQWIGVSVRAAEHQQGWFFEGFVMGLTHLLFIRLGLDNPERMRQAVCETLQQNAASERQDEKAKGLLLFCRFAEWMNRSDTEEFRRWWRLFWQKYQGQALSDATVRQAIASTGFQTDGSQANQEPDEAAMLRILYGAE